MPAHLIPFNRIFLSLIALTIFCGAAAAQAQGPMLFQEAAVSRAHIAFSYAGRLWVVDRSGGEARRLTNYEGGEAVPLFSPDGSQLAFGRKAGNNWDVYVMAVAGGEPRRLTSHPSIDIPQCWTPDGRRVIFSSYRNTWFGAHPRLFAVPREGGLAEQLPFGEAGLSSVSPDGSRIAYTASPFAPKVFFWRNYRGGATSEIQIGSFSKGEAERVPRQSANDFYPMWVGDRVYFVSDRGGAWNLFAYDTRARGVTQLTRFTDFDIKWASATEDAIVFIRDGAIYLYDLKTNQPRQVVVRVSGDFPETKPRAASVANLIRSTDLSPDGRVALVSARGEVFTVSSEGGQTLNITETSGAIERMAKWSPDGRWIAYLSDESGEYQLHVRPATAGAAARKIAIEQRPTFYGEMLWSPDSKKVALSGRGLTLLYVDIESGQSRRVDTNPFAYGNGAFQPSWSPDSRWLAYTKFLPSRLRAVFVHSTEAGKNYRVTGDRVDGFSPAFDKSGKYLYFRASANSGLNRYGMSAMLLESLVARSTFVAVLGKDGPPPTANAGAQQNSDDRIAPVEIDFDGIAGRILPVTGNLPPLTNNRPRFDPARFDLKGLTLQIDPRKEWKLIYDEAWRLMRDYFYDPALHGQDLARLREHYAAYIANLPRREDLNNLLRDCIWHLSVSHAGVSGGDAIAENVPGDSAALVGADFAIEQGRYRIARIYRGDNSTPALQGPLAQPGLNVKEGDYVLAVDGEEIKAGEDIHKYFISKAGKQAQIKIAANSDGQPARVITVTPLADETALRQYEWVEANRRRVEQLSSGKLGYIYLPDTSKAGLEVFNRDFYAQIDKQGLIIDERFNSGGVAADYIIDALKREPLFSIALRDTEDIVFPMGALAGPKVLVINEYAASGGDSLPFMFRAAKVGPIVGRRTRGAGIGASGQELIDGGMVFVPDWGHYDHKGGEWSTENRGVPPDIEVEITTADWRAGRDPQIEKAVEVALEELKKTPPAERKRPLYPRHR